VEGSAVQRAILGNVFRLSTSDANWSIPMVSRREAGGTPLFRDGKILARSSGRDDKGRGVTFRKFSDLDGQSYGCGKGPAVSVY
jgi:hypothetical protein